MIGEYLATVGRDGLAFPDREGGPIRVTNWNRRTFAPGLIVAGAIAKNRENHSGTGKYTTNDSGIDQGLATNDASGDVSVGDCETDFGFISCDVTIVNSSDGRSDYFIEATIEDPSGAKVGTANTFVTGVEGGQTAKDELTGTFSGGGKNLSVRLTEVQRTAS
jgi:hypothetical protein